MYTNTYLIFEAFQTLFQTGLLIFTAAKLFHRVRQERMKHKAGIHNDSCFETLNLLHVSSCQMFTFCDV